MTLSIFHGGFRREAAVQVAGASLETLGALVDKSLLRFAPMGRYEMHELLRQFAESRLNEKPGRKQASEARHCAYFADRLIRIQNDARGARQRGFLKEMAADIENIRAAWNLAVEHRNVEAIGQLRDSLDRFNTDMNWHLQGAEAFAQAVEALRSAELTRSDTIVLGQLLASQAYSLGCLGQAERAVRLAQDGYAMLEALGARRHLFKPCWVIPWYLDSHHEGLIWFNKALALAEEFDDSFQRAQALMGLAMIESELGYLDQAEAAIAESLALFREIKILWGMAQALFVTAGIHLRQGQYDRARQSMQESLTLARASSAAAVIMLALQIAGRAADTLGLDQEAEDAYRESMMMAAQAGHEDFRVNLLVDIAAFNLNRGNSAEAHRLFRDALALAQSMKKPGDSVYALQGLGQVAASARNYQAADGYLQEGLRLSRREDWPLATASILTELGTVATRLNQMAQAKAYLTEALGLALNIHALPMLITALVAAVEWFALQGKPARAVELLMSCRDHPACHAATKRRLERLWVELDLGLSANALVPAQRHSEGVDVEVIADALLGELATESRTPHPHGQEPAPDSLSEREYDVLRLMAEGLSNQEIAERLYLAVGTVKAHTGNIYSKLDVHSRGQAVVRARAFNLL